MKRWALVLLLLGSFIVGIAPEASACWSTKSSERRLSALTNEARGDHGRQQLRFNDELSKAARAHSRRMARRGHLFHNSYDTMSTLIEGTWGTLGENLGSGGTIPSIQQAFMDSDPHRHNLLDRGWRKIGVGVVRKDDRLWVTVLFTDPGKVWAKVGGADC
jgi:uncharacterized protein YkwD